MTTNKITPQTLNEGFMEENNIQIIISLVDPQLKDEDLQETVQSLQLELKEFEGVKEAELIPITEATINSKGMGGFLLGQLKALVTLEHFKPLVSFLGNNLFGRSVEIKAEGNCRKLHIKLNRPEDIDKILPQIEKFING